MSADLLPPRTDEERKAAIARAQARRSPSAMVKVFDPDSKALVDVPASESKEYTDAGFKVGPDAEFAAQEAGLTGTFATGALGVAKGASLGVSDLLIPPSLRQIQNDTRDMHQVADVAGEVVGNLGTLAVTGGAGSSLLARAGLGQYAKLGAAAARVAAGGVQGGVQAEVDAVRNNSPLTAERFMQGVGMGLLINSAGEGVGKVLEKSVPVFQKGTAKLLNWAKTLGYLEKVGGTTADPLANALIGEIGDGVPTSAQSSALGDEARAAFGGLKEAPPHLPVTNPRPRGKLPLPIPTDDIPFAKAELLETSKPGPTFEPETVDSLKNNQPMSQAESRSAWDMLDREAADAARMGEMEGTEGLAEDLRDQRDYYSRNRGMTDAELGQWAQGRDALTAPDAEIDGAFDRAGFNGGGEEVSGGLTELPALEPPSGPEPVGFKQRPPRIPTLRQLGKADKLAASSPDMSLPNDLPYHPVPDLTPAQAKYAIKNDPGFLKETQSALSSTGTGAFGLMHLIPGYGPALAKSYGISQAALVVGRRALVGALNREAGFNRIMDRIMVPGAKLTGQVVKQAIQGTSPYISQGFLGGDVDKEYEAISQGAVNSSSDPAMIEQYYSQRYGQMLAQQPELYGNIVAQSAKQHAYLASQVPKDPRDNPGMLDPPYDPPRSDKVKMIEQYKAVNDPYSVLANPTADGIAAVAATHPETLALVQKMVLAQIADPKVAKKLTPAQTQRMSILLQLPVTGRDSTDFLAMIQQLAQANGAEPQPQQQNNGGASAGPPNLGGTQTSQFASQFAPPSQQQQLEDLR